MSKIIDLSGKWKYKEDYGYGLANGELHLTQEGLKVKGRIIFTDSLHDSAPFMIQEFVEGVIINNKLVIDAVDWDIIHSETEVVYELDSWCGDIISDNLIKGSSLDDQGIEGSFEFEKIL
jgi:hypothetical protein